MTIAAHIDHVVRRKNRKKAYCVECKVEFTWWQHRVVTYEAQFIAPTVSKGKLDDAYESLNLRVEKMNDRPAGGPNSEYTIHLTYDARGNWPMDIKKKTRKAFKLLGFDVPDDWTPKAVSIVSSKILADPQPETPAYIWA